ncbi:MAG: hypothetical protein KGI57_05800 [Hyphomicrobiales bacterium]|nr:hypothetical protein [Hyphomicrobiales bacterium]MDE2017202.1 hypothetical protein [Hyphomicrobiales bacterium]
MVWDRAFVLGAGLMSILASAPRIAAAQTLPPGWTADSKTGCRVWNNYPQADDHVQWQGRCVRGFAQGHGLLRWSSSGKVYETDRIDMVGGKSNGQGVADDWKGHFVGRFVDNRPNGQGTLTAKNGQRYSGLWRNGCFDHGGRRMSFFNSDAGCGF